MTEKKTTIQFNKPPGEIVRKRDESQTPEQQMAKARMDALKQPRPPRGGAPSVRIPPLDAQHIDGRTMDDQAAILTDPTNPLSPAYSPELAEMQNRRAPMQHPLAPVSPGAQHHPGFRPGVGSMYAANQPAVTAAPQEAYKPQLRPETIASIQALETFRQQAEAQQTEEAKTKEEEARAVEKEMTNTKTPFDDFDYAALRAFQNKEDWNLLNNPERRKKIEEKLTPMKVEDVILLGEVRQDVEVGPNVIVTYRSVGGDEDLSIKQMMFGERGGDRYVLDKYTLMQLTLGIVAINSMPLPAHLDKDGNVDEKKFDEKFKRIAKFPIQFLANLGVNYSWFDERVRMLFLFGSEELKNG